MKTMGFNHIQSKEHPGRVSLGDFLMYSKLDGSIRLENLSTGMDYGSFTDGNIRDLYQCIRVYLMEKEGAFDVLKED